MSFEPMPVYAPPYDLRMTVTSGRWPPSRRRALRAVADDAAVLLLHPGRNPGTSTKVTQRDVEGVAEPDEPAALIEALMSMAPERTEGWLRDDPDGAAAEPREADDDVLGVRRLDLEEVAVVDDAADHARMS